MSILSKSNNLLNLALYFRDHTQNHEAFHQCFMEASSLKNCALRLAHSINIDEFKKAKLQCLIDKLAREKNDNRANQIRLDLEEITKNERCIFCNCMINPNHTHNCKEDQPIVMGYTKCKFCKLHYQISFDSQEDEPDDLCTHHCQYVNRGIPQEQIFVTSNDFEFEYEFCEKCNTWENHHSECPWKYCNEEGNIN
jgi:hypothetical protein